MPTQPGRPGKVEHEYKRCGAWAYLDYLAAVDVHRAPLFGRYEARAGIAAFDRPVAHVMHQHPYRHARRVFWIVDNGSAHCGLRSIRRLRERYPNLRPEVTGHRICSDLSRLYSRSRLPLGPCDHPSEEDFESVAPTPMLC